MSLTRLLTYTPSTSISFVTKDLDNLYTELSYITVGKALGQTIIGGTGSGETLTLVASSHATKGPVVISGSGIRATPTGIAFDVNFPSAGGSTSQALRLLASSTFIAASDSAAIQMFSTAHATFPGQMYIDAGASASGALIFRSSPAATNTTERARISADGNISLCSSAASFGSGTLVLFLGNCSVAPSTNPSGGGVLYVQSGALKYRGPSGTVTTLANA